MTKAELASYMTALISIMESKEDAGVPRGNSLAREYTRCYNELMQLIKEDEENEAGKRIVESQRAEAGAKNPADESQGRGSTGSGSGQPSVGSATVR